MKKLFTLFFLLSAIVCGLSNSYAQIKTPVPLIKGATENLVRANNQLEWPSLLSPQALYSLPRINEPAMSRSPLKAKAISQLNDSIYQWEWDTLVDGWSADPSSRVINIIYDIHGNETSSLTQDRDGTNWVNFRKTLTVYDASNNRTDLFYQNWDGAAWVDFWHLAQTYDANNNNTSMVASQYYDGSWHYDWQAISVFDASNNNTSILSQDWVGSAWVNTVWVTYTFDASNLMTNMLRQNWIGSVWVPSTQITALVYDINNNMISQLGQHWDDSVWTNTWRGTYTYDGSNNMTGGTEQMWIDSTWVNADLFTETYDVNNNKTSTFGLAWNDSVWVNGYLYTYNFDSSSFKICNTFRHWNSTGTKVADGDSTHNYYHTSAGITESTVPRKSYTIFPNPATDAVTLSIDPVINVALTLTIYHVTGALVRTELLCQNQQQIDVGDLRDGLYIIEIKSQGWCERQKLIIQR